LIGTIEFAIVPTSMIEAMSPSVALYHSPFAFRSASEVLAAQRSPFGNGVLSVLARSKLIGLSYLNAGFFHFWAKQPILEPSQLKGLRFGVSGPHDGRFSHVLSRLGAQPSRASLSSFVRPSGPGVDAAESSPALSAISRMYEVLPSVTLTRHRPEVFIFLASQKFLETMQPSDRSTVLNLADEVSKKFSNAMETRDSRILSSFRGVQIKDLTGSQLQAWRAAFRPDENNVGGPVCESGYKPCKEKDQCVCVKSGNTCTTC
jgi:TRAP-type C4-dicarboxylate transport system substrate-binding protein